MIERSAVAAGDNVGGWPFLGRYAPIVDDR